MAPTPDFGRASYHGHNYHTVHQIGPRSHIPDHMHERVVDRLMTNVEGLVKLAVVKLAKAFEDLARCPGIVAHEAV